MIDLCFDTVQDRKNFITPKGNQALDVKLKFIMETIGVISDDNRDTSTKHLFIFNDRQIVVLLL